jgi:hypothetical protein
VQLRHPTALTSEEYVRQEGWRQARVDACPLHPGGDCGFRRLGTYGRVAPVGMRVARWYCPQGRTTFSLLPDCLAARLTGDLAEVERVVAMVESSPSVEAAADQLRPEIDLPGAVRWVRRRLGPVRVVLLALVTLMPGLAGCEPKLGAVGARLGTPVLRHARAEVEQHLGALSAPVGFGPWPRRGGRRRTPREHDLGPDPPPRSR